MDSYERKTETRDLEDFCLKITLINTIRTIVVASNPLKILSFTVG